MNKKRRIVPVNVKYEVNKLYTLHNVKTIVFDNINVKQI